MSFSEMRQQRRRAWLHLVGKHCCLMSPVSADGWSVSTNCVLRRRITIQNGGKKGQAEVKRQRRTSWACLPSTAVCQPFSSDLCVLRVCFPVPGDVVHIGLLYEWKVVTTPTLTAQLTDVGLALRYTLPIIWGLIHSASGKILVIVLSPEWLNDKRHRLSF